MVQCGRDQDSGAPLPEDPSNDISINAVSQLNGIEVFWTYPSQNEQAVAFFRVMRSLSSIDNNPTLIGQTSSSRWFDGVTSQPNTRFYYWVQVISVQGTVFDRIGPTSAVANKLITDISGDIRESDLFIDLQQGIGRIETNRLDIDQEKIDRARNDDGLGVQINEVSATADNALSVIQTEQETRANEDLAIAINIETLQSRVGNNEASIQTEQQTRVSEDEALAQSIETTQVDFNDQLASVQQTAFAFADEDKISSGFRINTDVNGLVGGFGINNNGNTVDMGFNVDRFWIGRLNTNKKFPFIINNDEIKFNGKVEFSNIDNGPLADADNTARNESFRDVDAGELATLNADDLNFEQNSDPNDDSFTNVSRGMLWRDTSNGKLKRWTGNVWAIIGDITNENTAQDTERVDGETAFNVRLNADQGATFTETDAGNIARLDTDQLNFEQPDNPINNTNDAGESIALFKGMLWRDTSEGKLKRWNGIDWRVIGDITSENTANDTINVAGLPAETVRDNANDALTKTNDWTRPNSTFIDGNKIFTGDAYVDTLQIKGNAIFVPQQSESIGGTATSFSLDFNDVGNGNSVGFIAFASFTKLDSGDFVMIEYRNREGLNEWVKLKQEDPAVSTISTIVAFKEVLGPAGIHDFRARYSFGATNSRVSLVVMAGKR